MTVIDTSVVVALLSADDRRHAEVATWYAAHAEALVTTPLILAEIDHLLRRFGPGPGIRALLDNLASGALRVAWWTTAVHETLSVANRRVDVGLADASLVALAAHEGTTAIATLDERHFRTFEPLTGEAAFTLLPADAD